LTISYSHRTAAFISHETWTLYVALKIDCIGKINVRVVETIISQKAWIMELCNIINSHAIIMSEQKFQIKTSSKRTIVSNIVTTHCSLHCFPIIFYKTCHVVNIAWWGQPTVTQTVKSNEMEIGGQEEREKWRNKSSKLTFYNSHIIISFLFVFNHYTNVQIYYCIQSIAIIKIMCILHHSNPHFHISLYWNNVCNVIMRSSGQTCIHKYQMTFAGRYACCVTQSA